MLSDDSGMHVAAATADIDALALYWCDAAQLPCEGGTYMFGSVSYCCGSAASSPQRALRDFLIPGRIRVFGREMRFRQAFTMICVDLFVRACRLEERDELPWVSYTSAYRVHSAYISVIAQALICGGRCSIVVQSTRSFAG
eukprot:UN2092